MYPAALELLAQPVHVDLNGVAADFVAPFAQVIDDLLLAYQPTGALQEHFEQTGFTRREFQRLAVELGDPACLVVDQVAMTQGVACGA